MRYRDKLTGGGFVADPSSIDREEGRQIDWDNLPNTFRSGSVQFQTNGALVGGRNELQSVSITGSPTGGTFTLTSAITGLTGTTAAIAYNAAAAAVQAALEAIVGAGNVRVTGTNPLFYVEFIGALALTNVAALTASGASLTGGSSPSVAIATVVGGAASPTTLTVDALTTAINRGATLDFGNGITATVGANAAVGATTLTISGLSSDIPDNAVAYARGTGPKMIKAGTAMGIAGSSDGKKMLPRVATSNPAVCLLETNAVQPGLSGDPTAALTGYGTIVGGVLFENLLPDAVINGGTLPSAVKTELAAAGTGYRWLTYEDTIAAGGAITPWQY